MRTMITAHSGSDGTTDNSVEFLEYAARCDADAFEIDVHPRPGGGFYLSHDYTDDPCPDLNTAFTILRGSGKLINCDLKQPEMELGVLSLAQRHGVADQLLFSGSVSLTILRQNNAVRERTLFNITPVLPEVMAHHNSGVQPTEEELHALIRVCRDSGIKVINIPFTLCTDDTLALLKANEIQVSAWTVNDGSIAQRLLEKDIFNITTRKPKALCKLRSKLWYNQG